MKESKTDYWATCHYCKQKIQKPQQGKKEFIAGGNFSFSGWVIAHRGKCPQKKST